MGSGAPTAGAEIQEKMVRENGEEGRRRKAAGEGKGMEIDRELLSLRSPVDSAFDTLTANYGVKQNQFTKPTSEPRVRNPEDSNEVFDRTM